jgi:hypothetical protein
MSFIVKDRIRDFGLGNKILLKIIMIRGLFLLLRFDFLIYSPEQCFLECCKILYRNDCMET